MGVVQPGQRTRSQAQHLPFSRDQAITYLRYEHAGTNDPTIHHAPVGILSHTDAGNRVRRVAEGSGVGFPGTTPPLQS